MRELVGLTAFICVALQTQAGAQDKKADKSDKDKFQGKWEIVAAEVGGVKVDPPKDSSPVFTFDGNKMMVKEGEQKPDEGTFKLDDTKKPKEIDMTTKSDKDKEAKTIKGIYQIDGDAIKIAWSAKGPETGRPTGFDGKETIVITLKMKK